MATLIHKATAVRRTLAARYLIGRAPSCELVLTNRRVSGEHAVLRWNGSAWEVQDLGSRNGTFVNDERLPVGETRAVEVGAVLAFGDRDDRYEFADDAPPVAIAQAGDGTRHLAEGGLLILPDADQPELTIYEAGQGRWLLETTDGERRTVSDRETVRAGDKLWELQLPTVLEVTWQPSDDQLMLHQLGLRFGVSLDEEHVEVTIVHDGGEVELGARAFHYVLLTLARQRIADQASDGLSAAEHGWVYFSDLVQMLGANHNQVNVSIYRARRQFALANVAGATALFERRPSTKQIRLGVSRLDVYRL